MGSALRPRLSVFAASDGPANRWRARAYVRATAACCQRVARGMFVMPSWKDGKGSFQPWHLGTPRRAPSHGTYEDLTPRHLFSLLLGPSPVPSFLKNEHIGRVNCVWFELHDWLQMGTPIERERGDVVVTHMIREVNFNPMLTMLSTRNRARRGGLAGPRQANQPRRIDKRAKKRRGGLVSSSAGRKRRQSKAPG